MKNIITFGIIIVAVLVIIFLLSRNKKEKETPDVYIPNTAITEKPLTSIEEETIDTGEFEPEMK